MPRRKTAFDCLLELTPHPVDKWLMASYLYYNSPFEQQSSLSDDQFDALSLLIHKNWNRCDHPNRDYLDRATILYTGMAKAYPDDIEERALDWVKYTP